MTRKELCQQLGISVKTLRLYEEKGLITPEKELRNGREYRSYTPELAAELREILTLRRARFTMDEILTMRSQPEEIPAVFRSYTQWLQQETEQFLLLRTAAEQIQPEQLTRLGHLISELEDATQQVPLPPMDIRPRFRHLDELEEPPRHVVQQTVLDETVPNPRTFRQLNLVMDRNRGNNNAIAIGHLRDMEQPQSDTGPVQQEETMPGFYRIISAVLLGLLIPVFLGSWFSKNWYLFFGLVLFQLLWSAIPATVSYAKWLKSDHVDRQGLWEERKKFFRIGTIALLSSLLLVAGIGLLCRVIIRQTEQTADYLVCFADTAYIAPERRDSLKQGLEALGTDLTGDGTVSVTLDSCQLRSGWTTVNNKNTYQTGSLTQFLYTQMEMGQYTLIILSCDGTQGHNVGYNFEYDLYCSPLPEDLGTYWMDLSGTALMEELGLGDAIIRACISRTASEEDYLAAVELLRNIIG